MEARGRDFKKELDATVPVKQTWAMKLNMVCVCIYDRMCSLTTECVLFLVKQTWAMKLNMVWYDRMCSPTIECVLLLQNVFSSL